MPIYVTTLHSALPAAGADGAPPVWVHLLPAGTFNGDDGRGPYSVPDAAAVIAASMMPGGKPTKLVLDENHATDHGLKTGQRAPAQGWITEMQARPDGIWGRVDWTASGRQLVADQAYRGFSPVIQHDESGRVHAILRAGLTNAPNFSLLATLHSQDASMDLITRLRQAMGLADTADEAAVVAAAAAQRAAIAAHASQVSAIALAAGAAADAAPAAIVTALQARGSGDALQQIVALQTQVHELAAREKRGKAEAAIDAAMAAGKPIPPAQREDFIARHMQDPAGTDAWLAIMTSLHAGGLGGRGATPPTASEGIDGHEASVIALMGTDPAAYKAAKARYETTQGEAGRGGRA